MSIIKLSRRRILLTAGAMLAAPAVVRAQTAARLVVIGGGFGGATAARYARIEHPNLDVTLIEPKTSFITCPYGNLILAGSKQPSQIVHGYDGLKARGVKIVHEMAVGIDPVDCAVVNKALTALGVARMVVGHTVQPQITSACDGAVWRIDVGLGKNYGGPIEVLELVPGVPPKVLRGTR